MNKYKMDLHVHTPASNCYKDKRDDETYVEIIKKAVEKDIRILGITDHNTVDGYDRFFILKEKYESEKMALFPYAKNSPEIQKRIDDIELLLELFSKVLLVPGVEITLNPGVHIIVLADESQRGQLTEILDLVGYDETSKGTDNDYVPNMDVKSFLQIPLLRGKIVFAPHVDSAKGIYNEIKGSFRAEIFRSSVINAISVNSLTQLKKIQTLIKNDPNYQREQIWAYLNASDAHSIEEIGTKVSYVALGNINFESLFYAITNSAEYISDVENQDISDLINALNNQQKVINMSDIKKEDFNNLLCATLNSGFQSIIIGVDEQKKIMGCSISKEEMSGLMSSATDEIDNIDHVNCGLLTEPLGNGRNVYIILIRKISEKICYVKSSDDVYIFDKGVRKAHIGEIERLISDKLLKELESFQESNETAILEIHDKLKIIEHPIKKYKLVKAIEKEKRYLSEIVNIIPKEGNSRHEVDVGRHSGNCYFVKNENVILEYAVLRFSCPIDEIEFTDNDANKKYLMEKESIVITEKGGSYLIRPQEEMYIDGDADFLILQMNDNSEFSLYATIAWLKSKAFFWYMLKIIGDVKLYSPMDFRHIIIPNIKCLYKGEKIEALCQEVLIKEDSFMKKFDELSELESEGDKEENTKILEEINALIATHNRIVSEIMSQIDDIIFNALRLSDYQRNIILEDLDAAELIPIREEVQEEF